MNETILITGSNRGIGKAVALALAADGYDIVVHCRSRRQEAEAVADEIRAQGRQARVLQFDIADRAACREALSADIEQHGAYYGVVLNAGLTRDNAFPASTVSPSRPSACASSIQASGPHEYPVGASVAADCRRDRVLLSELAMRIPPGPAVRPRLRSSSTISASSVWGIPCAICRQRPKLSTSFLSAVRVLAGSSSVSEIASAAR